MEALGFVENDGELVEVWDGEDGDDGNFGVWPENSRALDAFLLCRRQWRVGPMGGYLGLDYPGAEAKLRMSAVEVDAELLADLDVIEGAALEVLNAKGGS